MGKGEFIMSVLKIRNDRGQSIKDETLSNASVIQGRIYNYLKETDYKNLTENNIQRKVSEILQSLKLDPLKATVEAIETLEAISVNIYLDLPAYPEPLLINFYITADRKK